ncbi:hypothetical protein X961_249 [Burkholderia pseudomallei MSHR5613]|uniref:hypothetical protein n=1 Tax=Burkholderia pseudomallei TaxID=28450 RepID=UPI0005310E28|nr:hypothetical protein [Burkholderia pseudomallei]KGS55642.1 hypothetical protein X961_249 [Burkholderia pseudomallei MSHR5613]
MSARDPFLSSLAIVLDRAIAWLVLTSVCFMVLWAAVWQRGLQLSWALAMQQLQAVLTGRAERLTLTLFALTLAVAVLGTSALCALLFARWRRQGELRGAHVRGPKLGR